MNIYLAFLQSKIQHAIPAYSFWEYYIKNGIEETSHNWAEGKVDWAEGLVYTHNKGKLIKWKTEIWEKTLKDIKFKHNKSPITLFLSYLYPHQVDVNAIKEIQKLGIPCVNFFCDNVRDFNKAPKEFAVFDLNWVPEYKALTIYQKANYPYIHLPMPMWVAPKYRKLTTVENNDISFIGSKDVQRWLLFEEIIKFNFNLKIYGAGWQNADGVDTYTSTPKVNVMQTLKNQFAFVKKFGIVAYSRKLQQRPLQLINSAHLQSHIIGKPDFEEYIKITKESLITLGVNRFPSYLYSLNYPNTYSRLRDIEAPMLGACYLTEYTPGLENMYELGGEIETYINLDELIEKINYLQKDRLKRNQLKINGQARALSEHSIHNSLKKIAQYF